MRMRIKMNMMSIIALLMAMFTQTMVKGVEFNLGKCVQECSDKLRSFGFCNRLQSGFGLCAAYSDVCRRSCQNRLAVQPTITPVNRQREFSVGGQELSADQRELSVDARELSVSGSCVENCCKRHGIRNGGYYILDGFIRAAIKNNCKIYCYIRGDAQNMG